MKEETCLRCGKKFVDVNFRKELPLAKRIYCNKCIDELFKKKKR